MSGVPEEVVRRLIEGAYEMGWRDACGDQLRQRTDPQHPIGHSKRGAIVVLTTLDPNDLLGLQP